MKIHLPRLGYADLAATLALALSVTGGAYAATQLPKNSVTTKQVRNGSLTVRDFKPGQLAAGPAGSAGPTGPAGPAGATGPQGEPGAPGPNLLVAGAQSFPAQDFASGCGEALQKTGMITVPRDSLLWVSASAVYDAKGAGVGRAHQPALDVLLLNASDQVVFGGPATTESRTDSAGLQASGWLTNLGGVAHLQAGTTYRLLLRAELTGDCLGQAQLTGQSLSWAAYPIPS